MKFKFYAVLVIAIISFYNTNGQSNPDVDSGNIIFKEIDSLNNVAQEQLKFNLASAKEIASKADHLALQYNYVPAYIKSTCIISVYLSNTSRCRYALEILKQAEYHANRSNNILAKGLISSAKGKCYYYLAIYDSAKFFHENAIELFLQARANDKLASEYVHLSKVYLKSGNTSRAAKYYDLAFKSEESFPNADDHAWNRDVLGEIYNAQRLFQKALSEHILAQQEFEKLNNLAGLASASLHSGNSCYMMVKDDNAKKYYDQAFAFYRQLGDSNGIAICYTNLSRLALESGNHQSAIDLAEKSISTIHGGDYKLIETATLQQLGDIYSEMEQYDKAIIRIKQALEIAIQIQHKVTIMDCYKSLSEIYSAMKKPDLSYANLLIAYRIKDSIQPIAFSKQLAEMQDQIETQNRENQITLLQQNNKIKSLEIGEQSGQISRRNIIILSGILIFILVAVVVYISFQKEKLKNSIETELAIKSTEENERLRFARDVHDDLGSGLTKINFLSEMIVTGKISESVLKENARGIAETSKSLIENMRDLIWALNPENTTLENLLANIREYSSDYLEEYPVRLLLNFQEITDYHLITKESHREILMTVKECLNNIVKHSGATIIEMDASIYNKLLFISIKDNGVGIKDDRIVAGNGLINMRKRTESIGGIFSIENAPGKGTLISITIGLEKIIKPGT